MKVGRIIIIVVGLAIGLPAMWFVVSNFKRGWDDAERAHGDAAASSIGAVSSPVAVVPIQPSASELAADFGTNIIDAKDAGSHYVPALPWVHGGAHHGMREGMVTSGAFEVRGAIQEMNGTITVRIPSGPSAGGASTLEIAVTKGIVRGYLNGLRGSVVTGYVWVEASPGHPGRVTGYLEDWSNSSTPEQTFTIESMKPDDVDAAMTQYGGREAAGVSYRIFRK